MSGRDLTGAVNGYQCPSCGGLTIVIHRDHGVTPMFLACRADGRDPADPEQICDGMAVSLGYPRGDPPRPPEWEWYRPTDKQVRRMGEAMQEHVRKDGLALRKLETA